MNSIRFKAKLWVGARGSGVALLGFKGVLLKRT